MSSIVENIICEKCDFEAKKETYFSVVEDAEEAAAQSAEKLTFSDAKGSKRARMRDL